MINARKIVLEEFLAQAGVPFAWGTADCLTFAAGVAQRMLGRDPMAHLRGRYDSEGTARRVMVEEGWRAWRDVPASMFQPIPVAMARAGDWALAVDETGAEGIGVVIGATIAVRARTGMAQLPLTSAVEAFRVE